MKAFIRKMVSAAVTAAMTMSLIPTAVFADTTNLSEEKTVDLVLFMGQSNMAGRGEIEQAPKVPDGHGYEFRAVTDPINLYPITEPFGENENNDIINDKSGKGENRRAGGMVSALVNSCYDVSQVPIVGVQCSQGGKNTKYFNQTAQLDEAVSRYTSAVRYLTDSGYTIRNKFMVWCQGESDGDGINRTSEDTIASSIKGYKQRTNQIFDYLETNAGIEKEFIVRTGHYNYNYYNEPTEEQKEKDDSYLRIAKAQTEIADEREQTELIASFYTDFAFENMRDQYHYHQNVYNEVGALAGHNIAAAYDVNVDKIEVPGLPDEVSLDPTQEPTQKPDISDLIEREHLFDFNGSAENNPKFEENGNNRSSCANIQRAEGDNYIRVDASGAGTSSVASSYMDLSEYTEGAKNINISFDMHIPYQSRSCVALVDKLLRGSNYGGSSGNTYSSTGDIFTVIGEKNGRLNINEKSSIGSSIGSNLVFATEEVDSSGNAVNDMKWAHYNISIDFESKSLSYTVSEYEGTEIYKTSSGTEFADPSCTSLSGIEVYSWLKGEQLSLDNLYIKAIMPSEPIPIVKIVGADSVSKTNGGIVTSEYSIHKNYEDDSEVFTWEVTGVDGVTIDETTGILSADGVAGNGTAIITARVVSSSRLEVGTKFTYSVSISDIEVLKTFEITSSDSTIDISKLETYGTDTLRVYRLDGSYTLLEKPENNIVVNTFGEKITIVPEYKFEFTNQTSPSDPLIAGYIKVGEDSYKDGKGYGLEGGKYKINENGCSPIDGNVIKIDVPNGFYDITVYRMGGGHADIYSNDRLIMQNGSAATGHNRAGTPALMNAPGIKIEGGNANISLESGRSSERIASIKIVRVPEKARKSVVWLAGDSETADYYPIDIEGDDLSSDKIMRTGIGTQIRKLLTDKYSVMNFAQQSYTAEDWVSECIEPFSYFVQNGDTILINFGMNDVKKSDIDTAKKNMEKIIDTAKTAGAQAVLISPICSVSRVPMFNYDTVTGINEMESFAKEQKVPFIDLNKYLQEYIDEAKKASGDADWAVSNYHVPDNLHLTQYSALLAADIIAAGLKKLGYEMTDFSYKYTDISGNKGNRTYSISEFESIVNPYNPSAEPETTEAPAQTTAPNKTPGPILYSEDFESYTAGNNAGWKSSYGPVEVYEDAEKGKYLRKASNENGKARSAYIELPEKIDKNFVFEADIKTVSAGNVSSFEIVENPKSIYTNHGVYSNEQYAFKLSRPKNADIFVVNNRISDSGLDLGDYAHPAIVTKQFTGDEWLHIKIVGNFNTKTTVAYITSLDGKTEYYHGMTKMSDGMNGFKCLMLLSPSNDKYISIDNIEIREATSNDLLPKYHIVTITDFGNSFDQYVLDGESVINIPDVSAYGNEFEGWQLGYKLYSASELGSIPIEEDCVISSKVSDSYIEPLESVEFGEFPTGNVLTMGPDGNTYADNNISLKLTGARGTSLVLNPNKKVTDYRIEWSFDGFRTKEGKPTNETSEFTYCDTYGLAEITEAAQSAVDFKLKNTAANYYGCVTAKVTYNKKTITLSRALVILGDKSGNSILPHKGYISDFSQYERTMIGTDINSNTATAFDGWTMTGNSSTRYAKLTEEDGKKFIRFTRTTDSGSAYLSNQIEAINSQTLFEQNVRFGIGGADIYYTDGSAPNKVDSEKEAFRLSFNGSEISLNGVKTASASQNTWYHIKVSVSPDTKYVNCRVYDETGEKLLGESSAPYRGSITTQKYYVVYPALANGTVDINDVRVTDTDVDSATFAVTSAETVSIPESGSVKMDLTATANTTSGFNASDIALWEIEGVADGVSVDVDPTNSYKAVLNISDKAASGNLSVKCTIDGVSTVKTIKLTGKKDNVAFEAAPTGVMIPITGQKTERYRAVVRNGQAEEIAGTAVEYTLSAAPEGVSINKKTGVLTVMNTVQPGIATITASAVSGSDIISRSVNVRLYNLKFSLGTEKTGYTTVNENDRYSDITGFGITGNASTDGNALVGNGFGFNIRLERGKVYRVTVVHKGELVYEKKDSYMTGIIPANDKFTNGNSIDIALFGDDILDLALTGEGSIETIEIEPVEKTKQEKPDWWTIGDSTVAQSGSWGSTLGEENDIDNYPEILELIGRFHNSGSAGRHHKSFYNQGWFNYILTNMNPGDVVSISGMGTNDSASTKELFEQFNNFYIDAIEEMGGYVVLGTYTPTGNYDASKGKVYDADNMIFKGKRTLLYEQAVRAVYEARQNEKQVIGFVDIGKIVDDKMTSDVQSVYRNAISNGKSDMEARTSANKRAEEMMGWWKDYNHYYNTLSRYFQPELIAEMTEIISGIGKNVNNDNIIVKYFDGKVTVECNNKSVKNAVLIHASYENGVFDSIESVALDFTNEDTIISVLKNEAKNGDKFFVWNSLKDMEPLSETYILGE